MIKGKITSVVQNTAWELIQGLVSAGSSFYYPDTEISSHCGWYMKEAGPNEPRRATWKDV